MVHLVTVNIFVKSIAFNYVRNVIDGGFVIFVVTGFECFEISEQVHSADEKALCKAEI